MLALQPTGDAAMVGTGALVVFAEAVGAVATAGARAARRMMSEDGTMDPMTAHVGVVVGAGVRRVRAMGMMRTAGMPPRISRSPDRA